MSEELKPCPFCGSDDLSVHFDDGFSYYVWCGDCGSQTDNDHLTKKEAIKAWNTRPAEEDLKAEVENLKKKLENVKKHLIIHRDHSIQSCRQDGKAYQAMNEFMAGFCDGLLEIINTDAEKGGDDE